MACVLQGSCDIITGIITSVRPYYRYYYEC